MVNDWFIWAVELVFSIVNFYGLFILLGVLASLLMAEKFKKLLITNNQLPVTKLLPWVLIPGIIGARLYHVIDYWGYYRFNSAKIVKIWQGGMGIFGGIISGALGLWLWISKFQPKVENKGNSKLACDKNSVNYLELLDLSAFVLPLGQAIGRWGNFFNQELYGLPTDLPWAIYIRPENRLSGLENYSYFHPLFLYESLGCLVIFVILLLVVLRISNFQPKADGFFKNERSSKFICDKNKSPGTVFFLYLLLYSFLRFELEFLRPRSWTIGVFRVNQLVSLFLITISAVFLFRPLKGSCFLKKENI